MKKERKGHVPGFKSIEERNGVLHIEDSDGNLYRIVGRPDFPYGGFKLAIQETDDADAGAPEPKTKKAP